LAREGRQFDLGERAFQFAARVVSLCVQLEKKPGVARVLANQLVRSGTSIGANIEEAQAGQSRRDFRAKNVIALKEARETHYWLRLIIAANLLGEDRLLPLLQESEELMRILGAIVSRTKE